MEQPARITAKNVSEKKKKPNRNILYVILSGIWAFLFAGNYTTI